MDRTQIIAEIGVNHNGDLDLAKKSIDAAFNCGADTVKFQTWKTENLMVRDAPMAAYQRRNDDASNQFEMVKRLELPFEAFETLKTYCSKIGIEFLSTPDDFESLDFLVDNLNMKTIKIGSGEIANYPFLKKIGAKKRDVILSTGMADIAEIYSSIKALNEGGARSITLLHCVSSYPAPLDTLNLRSINHLKATFGLPVGFSDHSIGCEASLAAVVLGSTVIEKHFTLDKNLKGPDHSASADPQEFKQMVDMIRNVEVALTGSGQKGIQDIERDTKGVVTKGIYFNRPMQSGETITEFDLAFKRPRSELGIEHLDLIVGAKLTTNVTENEMLRMRDLNWE